jgi:hypothetical protein
MPANNNAMRVGYLAGTYPGRLGHLYSPGGLRGPYDFMPFGLDNGRFSCWSNGMEWDEQAYVGMLDRVQQSGFKPLWVLVPDVVANFAATRIQWDAWCHRLEGYGWPLAFAVQDGAGADDVPENAAVIFVGGSTEWKRKTMHDWCEAFPRVHIGRINTNRWLWECHKAGAESCDGTGWMRGDPRQLAGLIEYLETSANGGDVQGELYYRTCLKCRRPVKASYAECPRCQVPTTEHDRRRVRGSR